MLTVSDAALIGCLEASVTTRSFFMNSNSETIILLRVVCLNCTAWSTFIDSCATIPISRVCSVARVTWNGFLLFKYSNIISVFSLSHCCPDAMPFLWLSLVLKSADVNSWSASINLSTYKGWQKPGDLVRLVRAPASSQAPCGLQTLHMGNCSPGWEIEPPNISVRTSFYLEIMSEML